MIPAWLLVAMMVRRSQLEAAPPRPDPNGSRHPGGGPSHWPCTTPITSTNSSPPCKGSVCLVRRLDAETQRTGLSAGQILWNRTRLSALAFTTVGLRHWYAIDHPMLFPLQSTFFLLGVLLTITHPQGPALCLVGPLDAGGGHSRGLEREHPSQLSGMSWRFPPYAF